MVSLLVRVVYGADNLIPMIKLNWGDLVLSLFFPASFLRTSWRLVQLQYRVPGVGQPRLAGRRLAALPEKRTRSRDRWHRAVHLWRIRWERSAHPRALDWGINLFRPH